MRKHWQGETLPRSRRLSESNLARRKRYPPAARQSLAPPFCWDPGGQRPPLQEGLSFPFPHLFGEGALRAIGVVLQTKVFVDLQQALLLRDGFSEVRASRITIKEPGGPGFESTV